MPAVSMITSVMVGIGGLSGFEYVAGVGVLLPGVVG